MFRNIIYSQKMEIYGFMQIGSGFLNIPFDVFIIKVPVFFSLIEVTSHFVLFLKKLRKLENSRGDAFC